MHANSPSCYWIKRQTRAKAFLRLHISFCILVLIPLFTAPAASAQRPATRVRVTSQVILSGVTRLGINLGDQTFYDSGQLLKNLVYRNPGFEGQVYRTIFHCQVGGVSRCLDTRGGIQFPANFWANASYEVIEGGSSGRRGTVVSAVPTSTGYAITLDAGRPIAPGDWISVQQQLPGDPTTGWWPSTQGGARFLAERSDLPPGSPGRQALRIEAPAQFQTADLRSYFDSTEGRTFLRLRGRYRVSFRAKALVLPAILRVHIARNAPGLPRYLDAQLRLTQSWAEYHQDFTVNEGPLPAGSVELGFSVSGASLLLDDVSLEPIDGNPVNHTVFRDEVVDTLQQLHPGVLRMMSTNAGIGSSVDTLLAPPFARQRSGYRSWYNPVEDIPVGIPEVLDLCRQIGAEPWLVIPTAIGPAETRKLAEYLAGPAATPGGALRAAAGHPDPWTQSFRTIHIELGNETWNSIFQGESIEDPAAYGRRANAVFAALRTAAGPGAGKFDLVVGAQAGYPARNPALLAAAPLANTLAIAPYLMMGLTRWSSDDELFAPLLAQPEQMSREGWVQKAQSAADGRQLAVYEVNLHTTEGNPPQSVLDRFTPSAAAGVAVAGHMLRMMRDHSIRDQMLFTLGQFDFKRADGVLVRLWGSVVSMGPDGRARPQLLAETLANRAIHGDMVKVELSGEDPTHDQPLSNDGVRLSGVHELDAYAFQQGPVHSLVLFNYGLHQSRAIALDAPGLTSARRVDLWRLSSPAPSATNEDTTQVRIVEDRLSGTELTLPPCSMAVVDWSE